MENFSEAVGPDDAKPNNENHGTFKVFWNSNHIDSKVFFKSAEVIRHLNSKEGNFAFWVIGETNRD